MTLKFYTLPDVQYEAFSIGGIEGLNPDQITHLGLIKYEKGKFIWTDQFGNNTSGALEGIAADLIASHNGEPSVVFADTISREILFKRYASFFIPFS